MEKTCNNTTIVRLFGIDHIINNNECTDYRRSSHSSSSSSASTGGGESGSSSSKKKLECQYCNKVFGNSQAFGGHQNAHKKERMKKKKRMQHLQARRATFNYYRRNYKVTASYYNCYSSCNRPLSAPEEYFCPYEEAAPVAAQISFGAPDVVWPEFSLTAPLD